MTFRRILVTVDSDPVAANAASVGIDLARTLGAEVALVHAIDPAMIYSPEAGAPGDAVAQHAHEESERLLAEYRARIPAGVPSLQFKREGPPAAEIAQAAKEWSADLIVIGSHGRRGLRRAVLGSVAEGVMRRAPCPVLVVRAKA